MNFLKKTLFFFLLVAFLSNNHTIFANSDTLFASWQQKFKEFTETETFLKLKTVYLFFKFRKIPTNFKVFSSIINDNMSDTRKCFFGDSGDTKQFSFNSFKNPFRVRKV